MDGPVIGAGAAITIDGIVERESGKTPPPPPVSVKTLVIVFVVMFVAGLIALALLDRLQPEPAPRHVPGVGTFSMEHAGAA